MNALYNSIGMLSNKARYSMMLDTCQGINNDPQRGEIPTAKEYIKWILKKCKELEAT
jgi:hypothetical protein